MTIRDYFKNSDFRKKLRRFYKNELSTFNKILGIKKNAGC